MDPRWQPRAISDSENIDQKKQACQSLQEMFNGSVDPEVVNLILTESDYRVEDAIEKLFTIASTTPSTMNHNDSPSHVYPAYGPVSPHLKSPRKVNGIQSVSQMGRQHEHDSQRRFSPKCLGNSPKDKTSMLNVSQKLVTSADNMYKSCISKEGTPHDKSKTAEVSKNQDTRKHEKQPGHNEEESEFSESFKAFMKNFIAVEADSGEWNSVSKMNKTTGLSPSVRPEKSLRIAQEESLVDKGNRTLNRNSKTIGSLDLSETSRKEDSKDNSIKDSPLENSSINKDPTRSSTTGNALPAWPDDDQLKHFQLPQNQPNVRPHFSNFRTQNMGFNAYYPPYQQHFQVRTGHFQPFYSSGSQFRQPMQWQHMGYHGQASSHQRTQPRTIHPQPRHPQGIVRTPHNSMFRSSGAKISFTLPDGKVLVLMRGLPGSGKTAFAQRIKSNGVILSTDDYFMQNGQYRFDGVHLGEAHEWNQFRARKAMEGGVSPVIIDNTNTQAWEMKPYVSMAKRLGYQTILKEPETYWKWNPKELFRHTQHGVSLYGIKNMMERYEHNITIQHILRASNVEKRPKQEQSGDLQCENQANPDISDRDKSESEPSDKTVTSNQTVFERKRIEKSKPVYPKSAKKDANDEEIWKQDVKFGKQHQDVKTQKQSLQNNLSKKKNTAPCKKKTVAAHQEESVMRSHGSRSPVQDIMYVDEEKAEKSLDSIESKLGALENNLAPKQQRIPRRRERRAVQTRKPVADIEVQELESLDSNDTTEALPVGSDNSSVSVEVSSECGSEESESGNHAVGFIGEHCLEEGQPSYESQCSNQAEQSHTPEDKTQNSGDKLCDTSVLEEKTRHHRSNNPVEKAQDRNSVELFSNIEITTPKDKKMNDAKQMIPPERDMESEVDDRESSSQLSVTDDAYASDDEESDDANENDDDDDDDGGCGESMGVYSNATKEDKRAIAASTKSESEMTNSYEDSETELNGFEFLNTCFPDIDDKTLLGILSRHHGDVTKAIESIFNNSAGLHEETREKSGLLLYPDSSYSSVNAKSEEPLPSKADQKPASTQTHKPTLPTISSSFQMTLEPAIAFHLLEVFGPVSGISFEGEFAPSDLSLTVDHEFSKLLYQQWKQSLLKSRGIYTQKDEKQMSPSSSKQRQRTKLDLHDVVPPPCKVSHKATDLREIMHEQMALEQSRHEQEMRYSDTNMAVILKKQKLYAMFPGVDPSALEELFQANHYELAPTVSMVQASCNLQPKATALIENTKHDEPEDDWSHLNNSSDNQEHQDQPFQALKDPEYIDFRAEANMHYKQREECFKKAALAFSRKQGQLAQFYASQGHLHTEEIKQANSRAAARILEHKNASSDQFSLDLHGLHVPEALQALEERLNTPDFIRKPKYISVITGRGLHSKQGKAKLKPAVLDYLQRNNYRHEELHAGLIKVFLK